MASDDVRALARDILAGLKRYGDKGLRLQMEMLSRAVLAQETRPTCATCQWFTPYRNNTRRGDCASARRISDLPAVAAVVSSFGCIHHQPAPHDQPRAGEYDEEG